jgi:subtilisin family serine protease
VLDTGVNAAGYPAFFPAGSMQGLLEAAPDDGSADDHGHGTHVASTVLKVAPLTKILAYDVFAKGNWNSCTTQDPPPCNRTDTPWQSSAINDVLAKKAAGVNIVAINMSLGSGHFNTGCTDYLGFGTLRSVGILPVVSAGNFFGSDDQGNAVITTGIGSPACIPAAVAVGATTDGRVTGTNACESSSGPDQLTTFSQTTVGSDATYGALLDVLAPGTCITAAGGAKQGTSMAAPHVAGAIAVLRGSWGFAASAAGALSVESYLEFYGKPIADARFGAPRMTRPRLDLGAAVRALQGTVDTTPPTIKPITLDILAGFQVSPSGAVPTRIAWSATDPSGIKRYTLWWRQDAGTWTQYTLPTPLTSSVDLSLAANSKWEFAVQAWDGRENLSNFTYSTPTKYTVVQENDPSIAYSGTWLRVPRADCLGGNMSYSATNGARPVSGSARVERHVGLGHQESSRRMRGSTHTRRMSEISVPITVMTPSRSTMVPARNMSCEMRARSKSGPTVGSPRTSDTMMLPDTMYGSV